MFGDGCTCNIATFAEQVGLVTLLPDSATAIDYFQLFFTKSVFDHVVQQTNKICHHKWTDITRDRLKGFLGLVILMD